VGDFISESGAISFRNRGRLNIGMVGDFARNHQSDELEAQQNSASGLTDLTKPSDPTASTMDAQKMIAEAIAAFDGDETGEMLFEGTVDGMEGQELREFLALSQKDFDSKRRFVRRRLNDYAERNPHVG
jgi:hypothetical protein